MLKNYIIAAREIGNIQIKDVGEEDFARMEYCPPKQRFCQIIHFVVEGNGVYKTSNASFQTENNLKKGTAFAIFSRDTNFYQSDPKNPLYYYWISFDGEESEKLLNYIGFTRENPTIQIDDPTKIVDAFKRIFNNWQERDCYALFRDFFDLIYLFRKNSVSRIKNILSQNEHTALVAAEKYIQAHHTENLSIDDIARAVNLTRSHFSRIFKAHFNTTPHEYLVRLRLRNAEILLTTTDYSISEIVDLLNFTDIYSFSKLFKKHYRSSPSLFRKKRQ